MIALPPDQLKKKKKRTNCTAGKYASTKTIIFANFLKLYWPFLRLPCWKHDYLPHSLLSHKDYMNTTFAIKIKHRWSIYAYWLRCTVTSL